jgi:hypothetical protein
VAQWWTRLQELSPQQRMDAIEALERSQGGEGGNNSGGGSGRPRRRRRRRPPAASQ